MSNSRLVEHHKSEDYAPQGVLSGRAARRCLAVAGVTVAAMIPFTESTSEAQAQSANTYICPGAKVAFKDQPQPQFDTAVECVVNAERAERGLSSLTHSDILGKAAMWHSQDMVNRNYFSHEAPAPSNYGIRPDQRVQAAAQDLTGGLLIDSHTNEPYSPGSIGEVITQPNNNASPIENVNVYMSSVPHCNTLLNTNISGMGSGTYIDGAKVGKNTINFTDFIGVAYYKYDSDSCKPLARIEDPIYKTPDAKSNLQVNLKTKKVSTKNGKRLQVKIDVDDLKAPGGDKKHNAPIESGTAVALQIKRKVGNAAFKTVLKNTFSVDNKGRAVTSIAVPSKSKWKAEVWYKLAKEKRFNAVAYAASTKK